MNKKELGYFATFAKLIFITIIGLISLSSFGATQNNVVTKSKIKINTLLKPAPAVKVVIKSDKSVINSADTAWKSVIHDFKLDHKAELPEVQREIRYLLSDKKKFQRILDASTPYIYYIHQTTKAKGLPSELSLIPFIESEFSPNDYSSKGAVGLWQIIAGTARQLRIPLVYGYDGYRYDGRRSITLSTNAALAHFKDLGKNLHGNWYLAIAAYNCGEGRVAYAKRVTGSQYFWNLPLPSETRHYVSRLLAVAYIIEHANKYGIKLPAVKNQPYFVEVKTHKLMNFTEMAKVTKVNVDLLKKLNPDYRYGFAPKKEGTYTYLLPAGDANSLKALAML